MTLILILRIALFVQLVLGLGRFFGFIVQRQIWDWHILLGVLIVVLALIAFRPISGVPHTGIRLAARYFALLPLATGLSLLFGWVVGLPMVLTHMALAIVTIALIEIAAVRQRKALRAIGG